MKRPFSFCIFLFCIFSISSFSQQNTFIRTYNLGGMNGGLSIEVMSDGGFVGTGQHEDNGLCRVYVYRIDECGEIIWFNLYTAGGGLAINETSDGGVIIAGIDGPLVGYGILLKLDANGNVDWQMGYNNGESLCSVKETTDGGYIVGGSAGSFFKVDGSGNVLWSYNIGNPYIHAVDEFPNGDYMFFGINNSSIDFYLGRVTSTGTLLWYNTYGTGGWSNSHSEWSGEAKIDTRDNSIIVTSNTLDNGEDILISKVDDSGIILHAYSIGLAGNPAYEQSRSIDLAHDGGYIIGGCANSFNTSDVSLLTQYPNETPQILTDRDIFLVKTDSLCIVQWTSIIGGDGFDKAIGVRTNKDYGYSISAYTSSSFFSADFVDPLFIKTDSLGRVGCQQYSPIVTQNPITLLATPFSTYSSFSLIPVPHIVNKDSINPQDRYMCLDCSTDPFFTISDTTLCIGDTTYFINKSEGLLCFQDWFIDGNLITASSDSVAYAFQTAGIHHVLLRTNCGLQTDSFSLDFYVNDILLTVTDISDFNGYEISCFGYSNGYIETEAASTFPPVIYNWNTINPINKNQYDLTQGVYTIHLSNDIGCTIDTNILLQEPPPLILTSNFRHDTCDRQVGMAEVIVSGGVLPYNYLWSNNETSAVINNLYGGDYSVTITDANNCVISEEFHIDPDLIEDPIAEFNVVPDLKIHSFPQQMDNPILFIDKSQDDFTVIVKWFWKFEDGYTSNMQNTKHSFPEIGDFDVTLAIENLFGCVDTIKKRVIVEDFILYIPNSFTPNGDGINELFLPKGMGVKKYKLDIFDRWGELIFTSNHLSGNEEYCSHTQQDIILWDGTLANSEKIAQLGIYLYLINLEDVFGMPHQYIGEVILIR
jgi:gliding motility-associated-like protein